MFEKIKLLKDGSIYTLTNLLNSLIPFLLLPGYTKSLSPAEFGVLTIYENSVIFLMPLLMFGVSGVLSVDFFRKRRVFDFLFSSAFVIPVASFFMFLMLTTGMMLTGYENEYLSYGYVYLTITIGFLQVATLLRLMLFQLKKQPAKYLLLQGWVILSGSLLTFYLVIYIKGGWQDRLEALFVAYGIAGSYAVASFIKEGYLDRSKIVIRKVKYILKLGIPLVPHVIGMLIIVYFDRFLLANYWGAEEVGHYAFAHQLAMGISLLQNSFTQVWVPFLFSKLKENKGIEQIRMVAFCFSAFLLCACFLLIYLAREFSSFVFGGEFKLNVFVLSMVSFGFFFTGVYKLFVNFIFYERKTVYLTKIAVLVVAVNLIMNMILIPRYGAEGASVSLLVSMLVMAFVTYMVSQRIYPFCWIKFNK